ncbi:hypothetical protein L6164_005961 [Bauhinia variegata]|uniref:Uncharacterized protein n=1 Tax=Bauhinia variegata TaxID=167791 RepID=A0ACB9PV10_BAUVA|nr:hypothetical protein L6164_005961 [Bauhinia variegata]
MDALNFLKFWRHATVAAATSSTVPRLVLEMDNGSDEEDSFFDLELTVHDFDNKENNSRNDKTDGNPEKKTIEENNVVDSKRGTTKMAKSDEGDSEIYNSKIAPSEPISKRKILPIEPVPKPQSPIALLKSAPSFRIFMSKKAKVITEKAGCDMGTQKQQKKEANVFAVKFNIEESCNSSPSLSRVNSSGSYRSKLRHQTSENLKSERFSKDVLQKYLKLIKPLYVKVSKRYSEKAKFSDELSSVSPSSSPSAASVSLSRKDKQGNVSAGIRIVRKHLGKSRSASAATGVVCPANRSNDTLLEQHDGIQSAILHCKRSFNSRDSSNLVRKSFDEENVGTV